MENEQLEILMGKFLDGEIEPSEQRLLETQLSKDTQSRRLFEAFQALHTQAAAEIAPLAESGRSFDAVFAAAWKRSQRGRQRFVRAPLGVVRFVSGMAAGLMLAFLIQFSMQPTAVVDTAETAVLTSPAAAETGGPDRVFSQADEASPLMVKDVDFYYYTDDNGRRWLIEGYRENLRTQSIRYEDL